MADSRRPPFVGQGMNGHAGGTGTPGYASHCARSDLRADVGADSFILNRSSVFRITNRLSCTRPISDTGARLRFPRCKRTLNQRQS